MSDPNVLEPDWGEDHRGGPGQLRVAPVGAAAGARQLGATVYEIAPGGAVSPYHSHHANEEMLVVLSGRPLLRTPAGSRRVEPGAVVAFPAGPEGAHRVANPGPDPVRVLLVSTMARPEVVEHVTTGATLVRTASNEGWAFAADARGEFWDFYARAMSADAELDAAAADADDG